MRRRLAVHQVFAQNRSGHDWVCGDLHGQYAELMSSLDEVGFNLDTDRLFLLGDLVDRGPRSRELLSWVLDTRNVYSVLGNHELLFIGGATRPGIREKHRNIGGQWVDALDFSRYRLLTTGCANTFPLTMTIETEEGSLGLVHAQSPVDDWRELAALDYSDQLAIDCTWPWNRATGPEREVIGVTAVVSGHIGTEAIVRRANQIWIDTLEASGELTMLTTQEIHALARGRQP